MPERRDIRPEEMAVIAELAMATPDLVAAKDRILGALAVAHAPAAGSGRLAWAPALEPKTFKELMEAVRLGVLNPGQARRFLNIPQAEPGMLVRLARLRWQRGGIF
ncbi:MAG TPA: hypothetical protein VMW80_07020 [Candidatus Dormibacteraeota bacterium]|nr:hypothetical protein [Candidatus Dormibacteraeota bacterium]